MREWSEAEIKKKIQNPNLCLLYLYTPLCGTCQVASKMLAVVGQLKPELPMGKIDLNYDPALAERWEIESVPCLLLFKNSQLMEKIYAFHSVPYLLEKIKEQD